MVEETNVSIITPEVVKEGTTIESRSFLAKLAGDKDHLSWFQKRYDWWKNLTVDAKFIKIVVYIVKKFLSTAQIAAIAKEAYKAAAYFQPFINSGSMTSAEAAEKLKEAIIDSGLQKNLKLSTSLVNLIAELVVFALHVLMGKS